MKSINISKHSRDIHFPVIQAIPIRKEKSLFTRFVKFLLFRRKWKLRTDYYLWVPSMQCWVFIPAYFIFDGASVPKLLNGLFSPTGMLLLGAVPHDFGYRYKGLLHVDEGTGEIYFVDYTKSELDDIFHRLNTYESGMSKASKVATLTLGAVGFLGWRENRKANKVLANDFPELFVPEEE